MTKTSTAPLANSARDAARVEAEKGEITPLFSRRNERGQPPSAWFTWHAGVFQPGVRVLDLASGPGRHALLAAEYGADVVAVDSDANSLAVLEREAQRRHVSVKTLHMDLRSSQITPASFDVVLLFDYLDRERFPDFRAAVKPGGYFIAETFLLAQRQQGWGPESEEHLLEPGELLRLVEPFEVVLSREVIEMIDGRPAAVASVFAINNTGQ
ncbi:MAG: class I SAM-dependent methyltransferase [Gemmatimonadota bacterium]|nr:class I SAM-dependent methyltransferase [Gemmatimonadota bacterium]MDH5195756.1 class I SAM-dependent methyltransferase [Gemmatimonadota bacterium]